LVYHICLVGGERESVYKEHLSACSLLETQRVSEGGKVGVWNEV
jgi:hypothetical protein